jgi:phosphoenolpyruvate-protein kinase (PTS system EI component)
MFPMVSVRDEVVAARVQLETAREELTARSLRAGNVEVGMMVEVPSAALNALSFVDVVDFFSIGTNDLTQYTLAAERGNPNVAGLANSFNPAVFSLIANVCVAARAYKRWVGVCGELAGEPAAIPLLVGLGVDELSMNTAAIARAKAIVRAIDVVQAAHEVQQLLSTPADAAVSREAGLKLIQGM